MSGKVGTLTFHRANNYGALLQCYALQQGIMSLGRESDVLDYLNPDLDGFRKTRPESPKGAIGTFLMRRSKMIRKTKFESFRTSHLNLSREFGREELPGVAQGYGTVIVGSDQVWNIGLTQGDLAYLGDFGGTGVKKRAYAASLGVDSFPKDVEGDCLRLVDDFEQISVREKSAADYLEHKLKRPIRHVCDPVFLLDGESWSALAESPDRGKGYVLVYSVGGAEENCISFARELAAERREDLVVIHRSPHAVRGAENVRDAGVEEFLGWIRDADAVVTESFHGCCFSVIFEKEFYFTPATRLKSKQSRIDGLLNLLSLQDRRAVPSKAASRDINFPRVQSLLRPFVASSKDYLSDCLR